MQLDVLINEHVMDPFNGVRLANIGSTAIFSMLSTVARDPGNGAVGHPDGFLGQDTVREPLSLQSAIPIEQDQPAVDVTCRPIGTVPAGRVVQMPCATLRSHSYTHFATP